MNIPLNILLKGHSTNFTQEDQFSNQKEFFSLLKQLMNILCGSGGRFPKFEKKIQDISEQYAYLLSCRDLEVQPAAC